MSENKRLAPCMLNWVKQHPEVRHQRWLPDKMIQETDEAFLTSCNSGCLERRNFNSRERER